MATHSSILAWKTPGTEEPGGLPSMGSHRGGHNSCHLAAAAAKPRGSLWMEKKKKKRKNKQKNPNKNPRI